MASKKELERRIDSLDRAVERLATQLYDDTRLPEWSFTAYPTLRGEVNAIIGHLGLEFDVQSEQDAKVVAKKTTKKGKK